MSFYIKAFRVSIFWYPGGGREGRSCGTTLLWIIKELCMPKEAWRTLMFKDRRNNGKGPWSGVDIVKGFEVQKSKKCWKSQRRTWTVELRWVGTHVLWSGPGTITNFYFTNEESGAWLGENKHLKDALILIVTLYRSISLSINV